ncbi:37134_t:CDS:2, partial [Gigaspora margarita]
MTIKEFFQHISKEISNPEIQTSLDFESFHIPHLFYKFLNYANPESYKEARKPFDANELCLHCQSLIPFAISSWMRSLNFAWLSKEFDKLILVISGYVDYLKKQQKITEINHKSEDFVWDIKQATTIKVYKPNIWTSPQNKIKYYELEKATISFYTRPSTSIYVQNCISFWRIDENTSETKIAQKNTRIIRELQNNAPHYHTHAMRRNYFHTCDLLLPKVKPAPLQTIYHMLLDDISATKCANEAKVDTRIRLALELGDPNILIDLHEHNERKSEKYKVFWD